jgi:hypothetical protein
VVNEELQKLEKKTDTIVAAVQTTVQTTVQTSVQTAQEVVSEIKEEIQEKVSDVKEAVSEVVSEAVSAAETASDVVQDLMSATDEKAKDYEVATLSVIDEDTKVLSTEDILYTASVTIRNAEESANRAVAALKEASDIVEELVEKNFGNIKCTGSQ